MEVDWYPFLRRRGGDGLRFAFRNLVGDLIPGRESWVPSDELLFQSD
jgi:hypothetical protein